MDCKLELVAVPVSNVDRAKAFYTEKAGFNVDHDHRVSNQIRLVQLIPTGSACSIAIGMGIVDTPPAPPRVCSWSSQISTRLVRCSASGA